MKSIRLFALLAILIALNSSVARAVGKQTIDPNSGGAVTATSTSSDTKIDKAVTYCARDKMLYEIIDDLGKLGDMKLYTGRSSTDWRTRELRMNIAAKDVPISELMQSIARVLKLKWTRSSVDGKPVYRLTGEPVKEQETPEEKAAREPKERRQAFFNQYMGLAHLTTADLDRLKTTDPYLYQVAKTPCGLPFARFLANDPAVSMSLIGGKQISLGSTDIPLGAANELIAAIRGIPVGSAEQEGKPASVARGGTSTDMLSIDINTTSAQAYTQAGGTGLGDVKINYAGRSFVLDFADLNKPKPADSAAPDKTAADAASQPEGTPAGKPRPEIKPDPIVDHPDEPDLHKKVKLGLKESPAAIDLAQIALADASGFAVVSDSFSADSITIDVPKDEMELKDLLDTITTTSDQNWEKHGGIIEFRDRKWASKREEMKSHADPAVPAPRSVKEGPYGSY